ncbi:stage III sporulation protein SpoIIIAB [Cohnella boryungensis]|jgi:stage III sporulation protein AB|uniref:Stage III sporulation protein SpoIIIAB n=1 Tax=Cohnella boryungensis TaxID=768479 RepID=A0ABV8S888_9BACL
MKFIGVLLVLFAGTMLGLVQSARYAARPRQIRELLHALQRLETEIGYGQTPLPEALRRLASIAAPPLSRMFADIAAALEGESADSGATVRECWERAIHSGWPSTAMKLPEKEAALRLGAILGGSGREDQLKHLRLAALQLQAEEAAAREDQRKYEKLSRSLGMLAAALIVILMI